jgi:hypothetical protein
MSFVNSQAKRAAMRPFSRQRGAATLIVVMILFFVVTLAAAYASRNLIFEQRTSTNQYRSTSAQETAEAGIEWALTMLNSGRIDDNCAPTTEVTKDNFRQRYLSYDDANGKVLPKLPTAPASNPVWSACVFDGSNWSCFCPDRDGALPALPAGVAAFGVRFVGQSRTLALDKPGTIRVEVNGCTSSNLQCLTATIPGAFETACQSTVCALLAQLPSVKLRPFAAITTGGTISGTRLEAYNDEPDSGGAIQAAGAITIPSSTLVLGGPGGSVGIATSPDAKLGGLDAYAADCDRCLFSSIFGLRPETYHQQQGVVEVDCTTACTSAAAGTPLGKALSAARGTSDHPDSASPSTLRPGGSVVWVKGGGGLDLSTATDLIGCPTTVTDPITAPVTLIIDGPLNITGPARICGLVYAQSAALDYGPALGAAVPPATVRGALVVGGALTASGTAANPGRVIYDKSVLESLRKLNGTFVRVPGGWRDFQ